MRMSENPIEFDIWEPIPDKPHMVRYVKGREARVVFEELRQRLKETGFLPEEYFMLNLHWENRKIPQGAWFDLNVDYGSNEGIYLDMVLFWREGNERRREQFATGKTLRESEEELNRMFLIASAIRKAFY